MDNCKKFSDLTVRLQELFKSASYSESTVKDMDFILRAFTSYMNANGIDEYSPEIGENMIRYCEETLKVCDSRVSRAKGIVAKLNRLYQGLDGEEALWTDKTVPVELPDSLSKALDSFILHWVMVQNTQSATIPGWMWKICACVHSPHQSQAVFFRNFFPGRRMMFMFNSSLAQEMTAYIELRSAAFSDSLVSNDKRVLLSLDQQQHI